MVDVKDMAEPCELILWCDKIDRSSFGWRNLPKSFAHSISTTHEDCPDEESLPCPAKGCGGVCRARPVGYARITGVTTTKLTLDKSKKKKKAARKKRNTKGKTP